MPRDTRAAFLKQLRLISPQFARAFLQAVQDVRSTAQRDLIEAAIQRGASTGNIPRAVQDVIQVLNLDGDLFAPLDTTTRNAFEMGAAYQLSLLPKRLPNTAPRLVVRFQGRHPRAEAVARRQAADLIVGLTRGVRTVVQETITEGIEQNRGVRSLSLDLVGRLDGNQRRGGLIGLSPAQAQAVRSARDDLANLDARYFRRVSRNQRFDGAVRRAIEAGEGLPKAQIDKITGAYANRLLKRRGDTIARTESNKVMNAGRAEAVQQMIDDGKVPLEAVTKIWDATPGFRTRDSHRALNGMTASWDEGFTSPVTGFVLQHPHDENAPAEETINCRCSMRTRIDWVMVSEWLESQRLAA